MREASHDDELPEPARLLALRKLQNHVDAFLLGIADEAARIHNGYLALGVVGIVRHAETVQLQLTDELLAIDKVLAAAKSDEVNGDAPRLALYREDFWRLHILHPFLFILIS